MRIFIGSDLSDEFYKNAHIIDFNLEDDIYLVEYTSYDEELRLQSMNIANIIGIFNLTFIQLAKKLFCRNINRIDSQIINFNGSQIYVHHKKIKIRDMDIIGTDECYEEYLVMVYEHDRQVLELMNHEKLVDLVVKSDHPFPPFALINYLGVPRSLSDIIHVHNHDYLD